MLTMDISFDEIKRQWTLEARGLDFLDAAKIFNGLEHTLEDDRKTYPEVRFLTIGYLEDRLVALVWTPVENGIRVISLRKCNEREQKTFADQMG
jgi:uncharacterized protein